MPTKKAYAKHPQASLLSYTAEDLRWATPEIVANYRAKRLKCEVIVDLGCGIGFQSIAFARTCTKVYAIELNQEKLERAQQNAKALNITNIEFIHGDALSPEVIQKVSDAQIIFCDPQRLPQEEQRTTSTISPNINQLLHAYSKITTKIAIEFPPQIKEIPYEGEREYCSVNGELNRLTLYFGKLKKCERSSIVLPGEHYVQNNPKMKLQKTNSLGVFLFEMDPAVVKAELLAEASQKTALYSQQKAVYFTSDEKVENQFFKNTFSVLDKCTFEEKTILEKLMALKAGKVILRYSVDPQDYWRIRNSFEKKLRGSKTVVVFQFGEMAVIAERLEV